MCSSCEAGYAKVAGDCVKCDGVNWPIVLLQFFTSTLIACFLLHSSTKPITSAAEIVQIWEKEDDDDEGAVLPHRVRRMLKLLGHFTTTKKRRISRKHYQELQAQMKRQSISEIRSLFEGLDTDRSGTLEEAEIKVLLGWLKFPDDEESSRELFAQIDVSRDGRTDLGCDPQNG